MSGQTLNDRLTAARHTLAGQGLARVVCKATTEETIGPKKKHLDYLLHCTNEPNVSIPQLANLLIERTQHSSWVVVFKALVTVHHLMCYGNERFTQYLASSNCTFQLSNFLDKSGVQGYDMSTYIRRYAKYLNEKAVTYRTVAFDFCKAKRGKEDGILRTMNTDKLLKTIPILQVQLDALLEFDCTSNDLSNGVINCCFMLLFRDLIRLFACYNDGIINLLEKYFDMNKKNCRDALDIYKKFLIRMDRVAELLKVAENVGIDKGDIPDLTKMLLSVAKSTELLSVVHINNVRFCLKKLMSIPSMKHAPSSLLDALEQHLASLEGKKGAVNSSAAAARATNLKNAVSALTSTSSSFSSAGGNGPTTTEINGAKVDENLRRAVEEEAAVMNQLKSDRESPLLWEQPAWEIEPERRVKDGSSSPDGTGSIISPPSGSTKTNPFLASPVAEPGTISSSNQGIIDLFSSPPASTTPVPTSGETNNLLCMGNNPFADSLFGSSTQPSTQQPATQQTPFVSFGTNGYTATTPSSGPGGFANDASFAAAFGSGTQTAAGSGLTTSITPSASSEKGTGSGLTLPVLEPYVGRSASPSPTAELMRGAGTTPILAQPSEPGFGDMTESIEESAPPATSATTGDTGDFIWGGKSSSPVVDVTPVYAPAEPNPFGAPFEPPHSASTISPDISAVPASAAWSEGGGSGVDLFNLEGTGFIESEQPTSAPSAPPPSPFGGLDVGMTAARSSTPDLKTHSPVSVHTMTGVSSIHIQQKTAAIDDLNVAIQKAMMKPSGHALGITSSPVLSSSLPPSGIMGPPPGMISQQPTPPVSIALMTNTAPASLASSSLTRLDALAGGGSVGTTPTGRASSTPGYCGTPTSGMSSPAKSVSEMGTTGTGFSAFGDVLQPMPAVSGAKISGTTDSKTSQSVSSLIKGDLDSSLASLAQNLDINGPTQSMKKQAGHQWGGVKQSSQTKTGGVAWGPPGTASPASNLGWGSPKHGFQSVGATPNQWGPSGMMAGPFPQQGAPGMVAQQPSYGGMPGMRPMNPAGMGNMMVGMGMNVGAPQPIPQQTAGMYGVQPQQHPISQNSTTSINDPFGAL